MRRCPSSRARRADAKTDAKPPAKAAPQPEFDLASLPSLDSITAATDIRAFLAPGVPKELARAALRRAWSADPAIRDFVGLAENDWDFTDPTAMPGFGALPPGTTSRSWWRRFSARAKSRPIPTPPRASRPIRKQPISRRKSRRRRLRPKPHRPTSQDDEPGPPRLRQATSRSRKAILCSAIIILRSHNSNSGRRDRRAQEPPPAWRRIASIESRTHSLRLLTHCLVGQLPLH